MATSRGVADYLGHYFRHYFDAGRGLVVEECAAAAAMGTPEASGGHAGTLPHNVAERPDQLDTAVGCHARPGGEAAVSPLTSLLAGGLGVVEAR